MFVPHLSTIRVARNEPEQSFDHEKAARQVSELFRSIAERVVQGDLLKKPNKERKKLAEKKIRDSIEIEERLKSTKEFMEMWNRWRSVYLNAAPITPKNKAQLTSIERAIEFAKERDLDLNILIAVVHRSSKKRKFRPHFNMIEQHGEELYERFYDEVIADIDRWQYETEARGY